MDEIIRFETMESLCRQRASIFPNDRWRHLAEAEMWHHRAVMATLVPADLPLTADIVRARATTIGEKC